MISIIDFGMGNLGSIKRKLDRMGVKSIITSDEEDIRGSDKIILPGVGHFAKAVSDIKKHGLWDLLTEQVLFKGKLILGICLGMQLMAKHSEEGDCDGFNWLDADVIKFNVRDQHKYKIPHMGWNNAVIEKESPLFKDVSPDAIYYFVHSYHLKCNKKEDILTTTEYDYSFTSSVQKNNIFGTQFHPEKSHDWGEQIFRNFAKL